MRFLTVAERELRAGARHKATHRIRWITALASFGLLIWLMWLWNWRRTSEIFEAFSALIFVYCILVATVRSADCLSSEKREGTMGLLFLTNLNGLEIIGGKLCSSALAAAYGLFAIFPLLAVEMLNGGITLAYFWKTVLALVNAIFFSIAAAFLASSFCRRQFPAVASAIGLALVFSGGLMALATLVHEFARSRLWANPLAVLSPLYTFVAAEGGRVFGRNYYWQSLLASAGISVLWLGLATWRVSASWRDHAKGARRESSWSVAQRWQRRSRGARQALRRRLLEVNPFYWLGGPRLVTAPVLMLLIVVVVVLTSYLAAPFFGRVIRAGTLSPMIGHMFAWFWATLAVHAMLLYYAAMWASRGLAEDKQTGALELVLSTPTSVRSILYGLWMAYARRLIFPAVVAMLISFFLVWQGGTMAILDLSETRVPPGFTAGRVLWLALLDRPLGSAYLDWHITFLLRIAMLAVAMLFLVWLTLGWVGPWLGLRMKHPGFAPLTSLALVFVPPVILFSIACLVADELNLDRLPERLFLPIMMWTAVAIGVGYCAGLSFWAARRLRNDFRTIVTSRFQPAFERPWWRPTGRGLARFSMVGLSSAAALFLVIVSFYGYQNWNSRRKWSAFKGQLKQKNEPLNLSALLPGPVSSNQNFALTPQFRSWAASPRAGDGPLLTNLFRLDGEPFGPVTVATFMDWTHQAYAPLDQYLAMVAEDTATHVLATTHDYAGAWLQALEPHKETLDALAAAAGLPFFQTQTNRDAAAVLRLHESERLALERLHVLFQIRACALLATDRVDEAAEDVLAGLQVVRLARQIHDTRAPLRTQLLLMRSLQPLWEGMIRQRWTEPHLAAIQKELERYNLLIDFTNGVRRIVLAHIEAWESYAQGRASMQSLQQLDLPAFASDWPPRGWWLENCRQLYQAGELTLSSIDVAGARVAYSGHWNDLNGVPVDQYTTFLLQQNTWPQPAPGNVAFAQTSLNQAIIACALQRYCLAQRKYPEALEELIPQYLSCLPKDVVRGRPMIYQNTGDGQFILRSVGQDQVDGRNQKTSDDWLWAFPTNAPPSVVR